MREKIPAVYIPTNVEKNSADRNDTAVWTVAFWKGHRHFLRILQMATLVNLALLTLSFLTFNQARLYWSQAEASDENWTLVIAVDSLRCLQLVTLVRFFHLL